MEKVTVAILTHNRKSKLEKTLYSLGSLSYEHYEVLVVDNGSTDGTLGYLKSYESQSDIEFRYVINEENYGYSKGKNICVRESNGDYVLLLDDDILVHSPANLFDELIRNYKEKEMGLLSISFKHKGSDRTKAYGLYFSKYGWIDSNKSVSSKELENMDDFIEVGGTHGGAVFFSKRVWQSLGGYDETQPYGVGDIEIGARAGVMGYTNYHYTGAVFTHLDNPSKTSDNSWNWKYKYYFSGRAKAIIKNLRIKNVIIYLPVLFFYCIMKTLKNALARGDIRVVKSFIISLKIFIEDLSRTVEKRKCIQGKRKISEDFFLEMDPPF